MPDQSQQQTLNIPQLVAFLLISGLAIRWFFFSPSSSSSSVISSQSQGYRDRGGRRVDERHVEQVQAMFPQYGRREVMWELMRNGGSVQATTERILGGRGLDPVCFTSCSARSVYEHAAWDCHFKGILRRWNNGYISHTKYTLISDFLHIASTVIPTSTTSSITSGSSENQCRWFSYRSALVIYHSPDKANQTRSNSSVQPLLET